MSSGSTTANRQAKDEAAAGHLFPCTDRVKSEDWLPTPYHAASARSRVAFGERDGWSAPSRSRKDGSYQTHDCGVI
jgi:hypothetical protein